MRKRGQKNRRFPAFLGAFLLLTIVIAAFAATTRGKPLAWENRTDGGADVVSGQQISLYLTGSGETVSLDLETYLAGVVAAEMSPTFEEEALKAQAIVARTFTLRRLANSATDVAIRGHEAVVCNDAGHCQAYYSEETNRERWGDDYEENDNRCRQAIAATAGQVVTYGGELAATFYHSTCGGKTASAAEVWGRAYPYLITVNCDWDQAAPRYEDQATIALADLPYLLGDGINPCLALADGEAASVVPVAEGETASGRVVNVVYGDLTFPATEFRQKTGINSTAFRLTVDGDNLLIATRGYGHGVGLCQQGANGMAAAGYRYEEILAHYYPGTEIATH